MFRQYSNISLKQNITDNRLNTNSKVIYSAINELNNRWQIKNILAVDSTPMNVVSATNGIVTASNFICATPVSETNIFCIPYIHNTAKTLYLAYKYITDLSPYPSGMITTIRISYIA